MSWFRKRLPPAAPLVVKLARDRIISSPAARELLAIWPGETVMSDNVDLNDAMLALTASAQADRLALWTLLERDPHDFDGQNRLLASIQSKVRSNDILQASVTAAPEPQQTAAAPQTALGPVLAAAGAPLPAERLGDYGRRGQAAIGEALGVGVATP